MLAVRNWVLIGIVLSANWGSVNRSDAREWTSKNGQFKVEAEAIAFNDQLVVLKKENGGLVAVDLNELSTADQAYIAEKETVDEAKKRLDEIQTWTGKDGLKIRGRIVAFGKKDVKVQRKLGTVHIDDKKFSAIDPLHQKVVLKVLSYLEKTTIEDEKQLENWAKSIGGEPRIYPLEGVRMELESGDEIGVPFFLFSSQDLEVLEPGWELWKERDASEQARERESFLMRAAALEYQRDRKRSQQIELLKLDMLAATAGVVDIWEVGLVPRAGTFNRPITVMVPAMNSGIASNLALQRYPGYTIFGVRRASY